MRLFFISMILSFFSLLYASTVAIVQKVEGIVKVKHQDSIKKIKLHNGMKIESGDIISTYRNAHLVLLLADQSKIVLGAKATIAFSSENHVAQKEGKVYYKITKRGKREKLQIKTDFAIIGIKGTTFIISAEEDDAYVSLKEGLIGIESQKKAFNLYKRKVMDEFERFKAAQEAGFQAYKQAYGEYVLEVTKAFDLQAGNKVSFKPSAAVEQPLDSKEEFQAFERLLE